MRSGNSKGTCSSIAALSRSPNVPNEVVARLISVCTRDGRYIKDDTSQDDIFRLAVTDIEADTEQVNKALKPLKPA
jgi:hypothetical protein